MAGDIFLYMPINVEIQKNIFADFYFSVLIDLYVYSKIDILINRKIFL